MRGLPLVDDKGVLGLPGDKDVAPGPDRRGVTPRVLLDDRQLLASGRPNHVLNRYAEELRDLDAAVQDVAALGGRLGIAGAVSGGIHEPHLLRADAAHDRKSVV